ncbi:MAG: bifunctional phosphoribosylaminoimidazolecarboxamide formyltransferase/IMP cyclohydrolase [Phycisphaerae bacterium]|jgi:phosphoribosylaminoimidazolecarboxamide formyltransferase/IMP cyclohydrolase|nr:bifunctional phosphoribosylaminoimidazolecarboxamide formyltransferase/IMP cyclohydrolase [Phycisphaerae bacterium]
MNAPIRIRRALLSVSDKTDLVPFARALAQMGVELVSTGGTAAALQAANVPVVPIEKLTGFPEIMDGRVKTLHPAVHGGLLHRRDIPKHVEQAREHHIPAIDLVCVNLYPFERTIRKEGVTHEEAIENIDIGGPSMLRSAAKNHAFVTVVTSADQYDRVVAEMSASDGCTSFELRSEFASAAFSRTAEYDAAIAAWMGSAMAVSSMRATDDAGSSDDAIFPDLLRMSYVANQELRYGENPHQRAAVYRDPGSNEPSVITAELLAGKPLSYNNLLDASAALELVQDLRDLFPGMTAATVVKHTNPCGAAVASTAREAFERAYAGDTLAAFGGIVAISTEIDESTAASIVAGEKFLEVIVAPSFTPGAVRLLSERWKNARLLATGSLRPVPARSLTFRSIPGGLLAQERDVKPTIAEDLAHAAGPVPSAGVRADAAFLMTVAKHLKSNAVCVGTNLQLLGAGAGQMDRVASCRNAIEKAGQRIRQAESPVIAASDAFFPFNDGPRLLLDAGVTCLVHPGGSKRDDDTLDLCRERNATCLVTGVRHFRH